MTIQDEKDRLSTAKAMKSFDTLSEDKKNYIKGFIACAALEATRKEVNKDEQSNKPSNNK